MTEAAFFYFFSLVAIGSGTAVITMRNPIKSAVALVVSFFALSAIYALLGAHFVAIIQVLVYAGAIMVLFIFVIMLLNLQEETASSWGDLSPRAIAGIACAGALGGGLIVAATATQGMGFLSAELMPPDYGTIEAVGAALFGGDYLLPFEAVSALLTVGVVGAVVLAKRTL
jgi:NADH-quinone oxidoreductase subunit J